MCKIVLYRINNTTEGMNTTGSKEPFKNSALQGLNLDPKTEFHWNSFRSFQYEAYG